MSKDWTSMEILQTFYFLVSTSEDCDKLQSMKLWTLKLLWIFFSPITLIFLGCIKNSGSDSKLFIFDELRARLLYSESIISCPTGDCPSFVGGLYSLSQNKSKKGYMVGGCSLSLIGSDQVLTNAHCIQNISQTDGSCKGSIRIVFPKTDKEPLETFGCEKILNKVASVLKNPRNPDWVILKLDKPSVRQPVNFDLRGVPRMEPVTLYKVNFNMKAFSSSRGTVFKTNCLANTNNILSTDFLGPVSPLFNVSDCDEKLIVGNSGSAILNKEGKSIGLFSFISKSKQFLLDLGNKENIVGGGTNGACIPFENHQVSERCEFDEREYKPLAIRYAYWLRMEQDNGVHDLTMEIHERNVFLHNSAIKFVLRPQEELAKLFFNQRQPMALLKSDFVNQAFSFFLPSFPECVYGWMDSSFQAVLKTRIPEYFDNKSLIGRVDTSNHSVEINGAIWEQSFFFEKQEDRGESRYKVTIVEMENSPLADMLLLTPEHDFHFYVPICK